MSTKNPSSGCQTGALLSESATQYNKFYRNIPFLALVEVSLAQAWGRNRPNPEAVLRGCL
jgi:hypothetical protein